MRLHISGTRNSVIISELKHLYIFFVITPTISLRTSGCFGCFRCFQTSTFRFSSEHQLGTWKSYMMIENIMFLIQTANNEDKRLGFFIDIKSLEINWVLIIFTNLLEQWVRNTRLSGWLETIKTFNRLGYRISCANWLLRLSRSLENWSLL